MTWAISPQPTTPTRIRRAQVLLLWNVPCTLAGSREECQVSRPWSPRTRVNRRLPATMIRAHANPRAPPRASRASRRPSSTSPPKPAVSKSTVSNVVRGVAEVSPSTRERVLAAIARLDYKPNRIARQFVSQRTMILGVLLGDLSNPYYAQMAQVVERAAFRSRLHDDVLQHRGRRRHRRRGRGCARRSSRGRHRLPGLRGPALAAQRVAAAHRHPHRVPRAQRVLGRFRRARRTPTEGGSPPSTCWRSAIGAIAYVRTPLVERSGDRARYAGYRSAMRRAGRDAAAGLRVVARAPTRFASSGAAWPCATPSAAKRRPPALFVSNDIGAIAAIEACESAGLAVPQDISVVGFDDIAIAGLHRLSLTTVAQPLDFQAERAVSLLLERIENPAIAPAPRPRARRAARPRLDAARPSAARAAAARRNRPQPHVRRRA